VPDSNSFNPEERGSDQGIIWSALMALARKLGKYAGIWLASWVQSERWRNLVERRSTVYISARFNPTCGRKGLKGYLCQIQAMGRG
jgi:hypothetical protein